MAGTAENCEVESIEGHPARASSFSSVANLFLKDSDSFRDNEKRFAEKAKPIVGSVTPHEGGAGSRV